MAKIVGVHGILYDYLGEETSANAWAPALRDGLRRAGYPHADDVDVRVVFYGDLFRPRGATKGLLPNLSVEDLDDTEKDLLLTLAEPLAPEQTTSDPRLKARTPRAVQWALEMLLRQKFIGALVGGHGERALLFGLRQVGRYLRDDGIRKQAQQRFADAVAEDTRVVVGHSLGSVIAYECLCTGSYPQVRAFVSLGSPLGMPRIVFDCLRPPPVGGLGKFPPVVSWTNVADNGDLVAMVKRLRPLFGDGAQVVDAMVYSGWESHDVCRYLTAEETGRGIAHGLA